MGTEKIANRQLWFILFLMRSTIILVFLPVLTSADALQDAWLSALVTLVGSEFFVLLIALLASKFPDLTIIEYSQILLGPWVGKILSLTLLWLFLQLSVVDLRVYSELIITGFLPRTPLLFISSLMVLSAAICVQQGIEVLGRMADLIFFIFIVMLMATIIISLANINLNNLQPVFARGWAPILGGALTPTALIAHTWVLGMLVPVSLEPKKAVKVAFASIGVSLLILVLMALITVGVLSPQEGARSSFPLLTLMRAVQFSQFLERAEILIIFAWGFGLFISVSTFLYSGAKGLSQVLNLKDYRAIVWPMSVIWAILTVHSFENIFELYDFLKPQTFAPYGFALLIIPLSLLWLAYAWKNIINKNREA